MATRRLFAEHPPASLPACQHANGRTHLRLRCCWPARYGMGWDGDGMVVAPMAPSQHAAAEPYQPPRLPPRTASRSRATGKEMLAGSPGDFVRTLSPHMRTHFHASTLPHFHTHPPRPQKAGQTSAGKTIQQVGQGCIEQHNKTVRRRTGTLYAGGLFRHQRHRARTLGGAIVEHPR
jgi:hypothetical protein